MSDNRELHVVSVSIGSKGRDTSQQIRLLDRNITVERIGTDGDMQRAAALIRELDGKVDAIGLGGIDIYLQALGRRYYLRDAVSLAANAKTTPVVCGAALKDTLERLVVEQLEPVIGWQDRKVLMVAGVDRFGMAEALDKHGADVLYGDLIFALGVPIRLHSLNALARAARLLLPVISRLPFKWIYPTGSKQTVTRQDGKAHYFNQAEVIAGDFHYIRRYAPSDLSGKTILTNTTTAADVADLRERGVTRLITTTPRYDGRSLPTNLLEAALIATAGRHQLSAGDYRELIDKAQLRPDIMNLNPDSATAQSPQPEPEPH